MFVSSRNCFALAAGACPVFTNNTVGSSPLLLLCGFSGRCYLEAVSPSSSVVLGEAPSFPAGEVLPLPAESSPSPSPALGRKRLVLCRGWGLQTGLLIFEETCCWLGVPGG